MGRTGVRSAWLILGAFIWVAIHSPALLAQDAIAALLVDENADRVPDRLGDTVTVTGVLTTDVYRVAQPTPHFRFYVQNEGRGIRVQATTDTALTIARSDSVQVTGVVGFAEGMATLTPLSISSLGPGTAPFPRYVDVASLLGETYEGTLVRARGTLVRAQNPEIADRTGQVGVRARDDLLGDEGFEAAYFGSGPVDVVGIAEQFDPTLPYDGGYRIELVDRTGVRPLPNWRPAAGLLLLVGTIAVLWWLWRTAAERASITSRLLERVRRNEAALKDRETLLQTVAEATTDVIWDLDLVQGRLTWGAGYDDIFGSDPTEEGTGLDARMATVHPEDRYRVRLGIQDALAGSTDVWSDDYRVIHHDGSIRHVGDRARIMRGENGQAVRIVGALLDITRARQAEEERASFDQALRQTQRLESVGVLAGGIAHDFNNILVAILGNTEIALETLPEEYADRELLENVRAAALRASKLTLQMLTYAGEAPSVRVVIDLNDLIREMTSFLRAAIPESANLVLELDEDLPELDADVAQIQQVVMNLITNAAEAFEERSGTIRIRTEHRRPTSQESRNPLGGTAPGNRRYIALTVSDDGAGIDPELVDRIFEPFFTTKFEGRGLGLSATLGIVRAHDGHLTLHTAPGRGSTFTVLLRPAAARVTAAEEERPDQTPAQSTGHALIVDDETPVRTFVRRLARRAGFETSETSDGLLAIEVFSATPDVFDIVFLDLAMPGAGGEEVFHRIRSLRPDLPVVFMSGHAAGSILERMGTSENAWVLQKPFTIADFDEVVGRAMAAGAT